jgi:hypothetical protein
VIASFYDRIKVLLEKKILITQFSAMTLFEKKKYNNKNNDVPGSTEDK